MKGIRIGKIYGINISVHWSVIVIFLLILWSLAGGVFPAAYPHHSGWEYFFAGFAASIVFFLSLLAHELSHAVVAKRNGVQVHDVILWALGGIAFLEGEADGPGAEFRIAAVGPFVSFILSGVFLGIAAILAAIIGNGFFVGTFLWLAYINFALGFFNSIPAAPLDGGRVLHSILWKLKGDSIWASIQSSRAGIVFGWLLVAVGVINIFLFGDITWIWTALVGWFIVSAARFELRTARESQEEPTTSE